MFLSGVDGDGNAFPCLFALEDARKYEELVRLERDFERKRVECL